MAPGSAKNPTRVRRFISQFAELEMQRQPGGRRARLVRLVAAVVIVAGLALALYDILSG